MKSFLSILLALSSLLGFGQTFVKPNGTVLFGMVVSPIAIAPPGYQTAQALIYYPDDYYLPGNESKRYPLYIFLHGTGEGSSYDISEVFKQSLPMWISKGLKPYNINGPGDTTKWIVVCPHAAGTGYSFTYPQLQYTIPYLYQNLRVDTSCVFVGGLSAGANGCTSVIMGNGNAGIADTVLGKRITGINPMAGFGYDQNLTIPAFKAALDTIMRRGCWIFATIGDQDQGFNDIGFKAYRIQAQTFCLPGRFIDSVVLNAGHENKVWDPPFPLTARVFSKATGWDKNLWLQMWQARKQPSVVILQASAGTNQAITLPLNNVSVSAVGSTTPSGTTISSYSWVKTSGPSGGTISNATSVSTAISGLQQGTYVFTVSITNSAGNNSNASVTITVSAAAANPPVVSAGNSQTIFLPASSVTVMGTVAAQGSNTISNTLWTQVSGPGTASISSPGSVTTSISGLIKGTYVFKLTAIDNIVQSSSSSVSITVNQAGAVALTVKKIALSEYKACWLYNDGTARSFVYTNQVVLTPYIINSRKAVDIAPGFNRILILDDSGYVWISNSGLATCTRVDLDTTGSLFNKNSRVYGYFFSYCTISKDSSTIWYWGGDTYNFYGLNGKVNSIVKPVKLNAPAGVKWVKLAMGKRLLGLTSAGEICEWVQNDSNYTRKTFTGTAIDIASGQYDFNAAIIKDYVGGDPNLGTCYWWGGEYGFVGDIAARTQPFSVKNLWGQTVSAREIAANDNTIHYIDSLNRMFGIGDNANGEVGNGVELVNKFTYPTPFSWSWTKGEAFTGAPAIQIGAGITWKHLYASSVYAFYMWAQDINDSCYNWGRDKSFIGGKGLVNNNEVATPNSLDVLSPKLITPLNNSPAVGFNFAFPTTNAGNDQVIALTTTLLSGTATAAKSGTWGYNISGYKWNKISGPACVITSSTSASTTVTGMSSGTYLFQLIATDNNTATWADTVQIIVNTTVPNVNAGIDQNITLPGILTLFGSASGQGANTISSHIWSNVSGPNTPTITSTGNYSTTVSGLIPGIYTFRLTAVDNLGNSGNDTVTVTVNPSGNNFYIFSHHTRVN